MEESRPRKRQIVISIDDWCDERFATTDIEYFNDQLSRMLMDYDVEITKVEIKEADEARQS